MRGKGMKSHESLLVWGMIILFDEAEKMVVVVKLEGIIRVIQW
jgi:hypothetical protein